MSEFQEFVSRVILQQGIKPGIYRVNDLLSIEVINPTNFAVHVKDDHLVEWHTVPFTLGELLEAIPK